MTRTQDLEHRMSCDIPEQDCNFRGVDADQNTAM